MENRITHQSSGPSHLSGALVVAHPDLLDPHFRKTVVLVSSHSEDDGAVGTIINRPMNTTLGDFDPEFSLDSLAGVPVYEGGPVAAEELMFMAWKWSEEQGVLRLAYGVDRDQARRLLTEEAYEVRAFLGCAGWGAGAVGR